MKILLLTDGITPFVLGGMQKHSANLAKYLTLAGVEVTLVHCVAHGERLITEDEVNKSLFQQDQTLVNSICLNFPEMGKMPGHYLKESYQYSDLIFQKIKNNLNDFDFIYAKGFSAWKLLHEKTKGMEMPPVGVKFHGYEMYQKPPSFRAKFERLFLRKPVKWNTENADYVFSYGAKITGIIEELGVPTNKILEIPSGIDDDWIRESKLQLNKPLKFVFLGRYERRKGIEELTKVLNSIVENNVFEFHFIGPIPENKRIENGKVIYHGVIQDKQKLTNVLDSCDVLVCPSHSEGMPNVILEGMSRGLAVIATDVGAVRLLVSEKVGVLLKEIGVEDLEKAILSMVSMDDKVLLDKKRNALELVNSQFKWERIASQTIEKINKVL